MKRNAESCHLEVKKKYARATHDGNSDYQQSPTLDKMTRTPSKRQSIEKFNDPFQDTFLVKSNSSPLEYVRVHSQEDLSASNNSLGYLITTPYLRGNKDCEDDQQQYFTNPESTSDNESNSPLTSRVISQTPSPELHRKKCKVYAKFKRRIVAEQTTKAINAKEMITSQPTASTLDGTTLVCYSSTSESSDSSSESDCDNNIKESWKRNLSRSVTWAKVPLVSPSFTVDREKDFKSPVCKNAQCSPKPSVNATSFNWKVLSSIPAATSCTASSTSQQSELTHTGGNVQFKWSPHTPPPFWGGKSPNEKESHSLLFSHIPVCDRSPDITYSSPQSTYPVAQHMRRKAFAHLPDYDIEDIFSINVGFIDTHCHLDFLFKRADFKGTFTAYQLIHKDTFPKSFHGCVAVFCDPQTFSKKHIWENILQERNVWGAFGCHPHMASEYNDTIEQHLLNALTSNKVVALGEIGLDYSFKNTCNRDVQKGVFRRQLKLALKCKLPLVIHSRDSSSDTLQILREIVPTTHLIHRHCFTGKWEEAEEWLYLFPNLYIGLTPLVTYPAARDVHRVASNIPLNRLLLETDTPYFLPRNVNRDKRWSHPGMAIHVAAQVAALRPNDTLEDVLQATRENTRNMYGI